MVSLKSVQRRDVRDNVVTFQRGSKSTSRRSRGVQNQRRDVGISRRDVPEEGKIDVATLKRHDVESQRRDVTEKGQNSH